MPDRFLALSEIVTLLGGHGLSPRDLQSALSIGISEGAILADAGSPLRATSDPPHLGAARDRLAEIDLENLDGMPRYIAPAAPLADERRVSVHSAVRFLEFRLGLRIVVPSEEASDSPPTKRGGGRPAIYPWQTLEDATYDHVYEDGMPSVKADVLRWMVDWLLQNNQGKAPDETAEDLKNCLERVIERRRRALLVLETQERQKRGR